MGKKDRVIRSTNKRVDRKVLPKSEVEELKKMKGDPLPNHVKQELENSLGANLSGVRVHTGPSAVRMAKTLNAQAFTHGRDIYFNSGAYDPQTSEGRKLLAHELTHVLQQK
ncbi:MAG: DUF4157 domain-containing protein [Pyrinomonadaceae bacterium]|nr:DUF4157 domain-containing protein [Pyrinomonadaceae bacterium]